MRMTFRWYGENDDKITLQQIDQIPGMDGIVGALFDIPVGEVWPVEPLLHIKQQAEANNLVFKDLESINVHEDIKLGLPSRDQYIENYITSLRNAAKAGIQMVCYNFMPVFDWTRTDLAKPFTTARRYWLMTTILSPARHRRIWPGKSSTTAMASSFPAGNRNG